ncbi:tyrosine transaminase [Cavenderia fasciculata]|uniref:Tyrosine aminotransferase n=1 Tax=Cavenderia fasciculata TaxID=261658 RepID=F4PU70_CACFS|nr:tyrosine transaminase [Cavenderia fasciculata]EGG20996.1 tyrosine transaminase [Cavenderia fasciculata]|eukprot:XP_004358846.1 tyrosine transaminase [Cavenderia fasciculata]
MMSGWNIQASVAAKSTTNPIRAIVDTGKYKPNPEKALIPLSIGDPCVFGNLSVTQYVNQQLVNSINSDKYNGYPPSIGYPSARAAVAKFVQTPSSPLSADDIILASGASGAIEIALTALLNQGDNVLVPQPGFSLYECICKSKGFDLKHYNLIPSRSWEIDIDHLRSLIDTKTKAILINNPSNPCGSVYSKEHLQQILQVAEEYHLPIISDEIYAGMTWGGAEFIPIASLTTVVPVLSIGGIAKRFLVPGWRVGWIAIHDRNNVFDQIRKAIVSLSQLILGPNSLIQSVLPEILNTENPEIARFFNETNQTLEKHSRLTVESLSKIDGLNPISSSGTMYQMIGFDTSKFNGIEDDVVFMGKLLEEESVFVLPGTVFGMKNYFRIVFCAPNEKLQEAYTRIESFCNRHRKN